MSTYQVPSQKTRKMKCMRCVFEQEIHEAIGAHLTEHDFCRHGLRNTCATRPRRAGGGRRGTRTRGERELRHTRNTHKQVCAPPKITEKKFRKHAKRTRWISPTLRNTCATRPTFWRREARHEERRRARARKHARTHIHNKLCAQK